MRGGNITQVNPQLTYVFRALVGVPGYIAWVLTNIGLQMPPANPDLARRKNPARSRIGNGSALLPGIDGRSTWVRRCRELIQDHTADLGGLDNTSVAEQSIVRRCAVLTVALERMEVGFATAGEASANT
jgi:hypothetical protein